MSLAANKASICYSHLEWGEDALSVYFAHMKNDQSGTRPRDPRHVYANPINPEICPILALGIYWATYGVDDTGKLFPGSNQYDRFRKILSRFLQKPALVEELQQRGIDPSHVGTHSLRKGAATYCSSGSTACPSAIAVHLRTGWSLGGVENRYLRHDAAGDMHVGRTVCGLPFGDADFAMLPPRFHGECHALSRPKRICFRGLPPSLSGVGEFALASLLYYLPMLRRVLPSCHPLFENPLFANVTLIDELKNALQGPTRSAMDLAPTGIPPHVMLLEKMRQLEDAQASLSDCLVDGVTRILDERDDRCGVPTRDGIAVRVVELLESAGYARRQEDSDTEQPSGASTDCTVAGLAYHFWGGGFHLFPPGVTLPTGTIEQAWLRWCCGDPAHNLPPFRHLSPADLPTRNEKKRLSDLRFLMKRIDARALAPKLKITQISMLDAVSVFEQCKDAIFISAATGRGRKRRQSQLVWLSVASELRKAARTSAITMTPQAALGSTQSQ